MLTTIAYINTNIQDQVQDQDQESRSQDQVQDQDQVLERSRPSSGTRHVLEQDMFWKDQVQNQYQSPNVPEQDQDQVLEHVLVQDQVQVQEQDLDQDQSPNTPEQDLECFGTSNLEILHRTCSSSRSSSKIKV